MPKKKVEVDMTNGPLMGKMIRFTIPIVLSGVLQLLFNAADVVVVGRYAGSQALAAVGSTGSLCNLLVNLVMVLSVGTNVMVARDYGLGRQEEVEKTVHTAVAISLLGGVLLAAAGIFLSRPLLHLMGSPDDVIDLSALYMRIYFLGMPATLLYNYGSSVLKAVGDADHPLYYLLAAGVINVILNITFVCVFHMTVDGVAIATVISQCFSAFMVLRHLSRLDSAIHFDLRKVRLHGGTFVQILRIGLPAGIQDSLFSLSNVTIQSSINSFGSVIMAGNSASASLEGFVHTTLTSVNQTAINFTSQNFGAKKYDRTWLVLRNCLLLVTAAGLFLALAGRLFGVQLLHIYSNDEEVIRYGLIRMRMVFTTYVLCGIMETLVGYIRGMGYSIMPTVVTLLGVCALRILWVNTVFAQVGTMESLYVLSGFLADYLHCPWNLHIYHLLEV